MASLYNQISEAQINYKQTHKSTYPYNEQLKKFNVLFKQFEAEPWLNITLHSGKKIDVTFKGKIGQPMFCYYFEFEKDNNYIQLLFEGANQNLHILECRATPDDITQTWKLYENVIKKELHKNS